MKYLVVVGDGMADEPLEVLGGRTPLQAARTPNLDFFADKGRMGLVRTVPEGMPPGSDVANLSLLGFSPRKYYTGRAPLEAASMGIQMGPEDIAFRCNLVTLSGPRDTPTMADHSGGGISSARARVGIEALNRALADETLHFWPGVAYRHLLLWKGGKCSLSGLETTPPHDILGQPAGKHLPHGPGSEAVRTLMEEGSRVLRSSLPPSSPGTSGEGNANAIWLWGQGHSVPMPTLLERFGLTGVTVSAVDLIWGLGRSCGLPPIRVPGANAELDTNYQGKAFAALQALKAYDFVFLHVEAPDEAGHRGSVEEKVTAIELFDEQVLGVLRRGLEKMAVPHRLLVLPDHPTPIHLRTHSDTPVPFALYANPATLFPKTFPETTRMRARTFDEDAASQTGVILEEGHRILEILLEPPVS